MNTAQSSLPTNRYLREQDFFNHVFRENAREAAIGKFYSISASSLARYHALILDDCNGKQSLECGCGPGGVTFNLGAAGAAATAIDISDVAIETCRSKAREKGIEARFVQMNAEETTFAPASFDIICGNGVLHHLDLGKALAEFARLLKPDGKAVFLEPLGHNPLINLYRKVTPRLRTADEHPLLMSDLELAREHFADIDADFYHCSSLAAVPFRKTRAFPNMSATLDRFDQWLFHNFPFWSKYAWVSVLQFRGPRRRAATIARS